MICEAWSVEALMALMACTIRSRVSWMRREVWRLLSESWSALRVLSAVWRLMAASCSRVEEISSRLAAWSAAPEASTWLDEADCAAVSPRVAADSLSLASTACMERSMERLVYTMAAISTTPRASEP